LARSSGERPLSVSQIFAQHFGRGFGHQEAADRVAESDWSS
jgi:hypothetical protein